MKIRKVHGAALLLSTALAAAGASAGESRFAQWDAGGDVAAAKQEAAMAARLRNEEVRLRAERAAYPAYFKRAYAAYPQIPRGTLEAIAYVQSRWQHVRAEDAGAMDDHGHMPAAHGVMGLYAGGGFADQVGEAAALLGVPAEQVRRDPATNIMAAAALLGSRLRGRDVRDLESLAPELASYAGFSPSPVGGAIDDYARASFAFDVLLAQDRGVDEKGMVVPQTAVAWEQAFDPETLVRLQAPFVRLDVAGDRIEVDGYAIDPVSEQLVRKPSPKEGDGRLRAQSTDYGPAIWNPAHSSNYNASRSAAVSAVTLHTAQGSYAGTISWFKNSTANVSAHYVIRSSDGQVTQMVRNAHTAWHVRNQNSYTLGIEHEGYVNNSSWYTSAMYNASAALVRDFCARYSAVTCSSAYRGAPSSGINVLPTSVKIKGHQHFSGQTHTDPGINWNWASYYTLLNPGSGGSTTWLDRFESNVGHFNTSPAYSGSTAGISTASTATRNCSTRRNGSCSLQVLLKDNPNTSAAWAVRLLSGGGNPGSIAAVSRANGSVGFWVYAGGSGMSVGIGIDDSDGTERSVSRALAANSWTYVSWSLTDANQWNAWVGGNGAITAASVKVDAIWLYHANTSYDINVYIDDVQVRN
ncbi:peptidoglycan recognition family protein [Luteimonas sp. MC1895]|uniref:N-acetylmuramoyl-L-alanine amidase n=1 Tax=Luteimonas sp. MC1895 TaxID=2819513 RepID=UPI0018F10058|nr:peptidoglycan recognition family protein [Luteimonas sp. MC1895]MBJ6978411.1 N-acetylmuramoyl-L-alanine amidase [Luteimonas sp. MC1895]